MTRLLASEFIRSSNFFRKDIRLLMDSLRGAYSATRNDQQSFSQQMVSQRGRQIDMLHHLSCIAIASHDTKARNHVSVCTQTSADVCVKDKKTLPAHGIAGPALMFDGDFWPPASEASSIIKSEPCPSQYCTYLTADLLLFAQATRQRRKLPTSNRVFSLWLLLCDG